MAIEFEDPIVAGTVLVRELIRSQDFVAGVSGWAIYADGDAEFNNLIARGIFKTADSGRRVEITDDPEPSVRFFSGHVSEVSPAFLEAEESGSSIQTRLSGGDFGGGSALLLLSSTAGGNSGSLTADALTFTGDPILLNPPTATDWIAVINSTGGSTKDAMIVRHDGINPEGWTAATLAGTWTNLGGGWPTTRYRKDPDGFVHLLIAATGGAAPPSTIFTLPVGYRPAAFTPLIGEGNLAHARATVLSTGVVQYNVGSTTNVLFNVRFPSTDVT